MNGIRLSGRNIGLNKYGIRNFSCSSVVRNGPGRFHKDSIEAKEKLDKLMNHKKAWVRLGVYMGTKEFQGKVMKWSLFAYGAFVIYGMFHLKKIYLGEREKEELNQKNFKEPETMSEYETLRMKMLNGGKMRTRDVLRLEQYSMLKEEYDAQVKKGKTVEELGPFDPKPEDIDIVESPKENESSFILPARDTTEFYEGKASNYDEEIKWEERIAFIGRRRKWAMKHVYGDVLEVACGTGRNIPYLKLDKINSITFLDSSEKMVELTHENFRKSHPNFQKAGFVVGKAEDLLDLANGVKPEKKDELENPAIEHINEGSKIKYDTIVETFGLCSHEDPVKALNNMLQLLKPDGRIILLEHGRGNWKFVNRRLDKRAEKRLDTWGCRWNLDIGELLDDSGLEIVSEDRSQFGTTWCIIAKRPGDMRQEQELTFFQKYVKGLGYVPDPRKA